MKETELMKTLMNQRIPMPNSLDTRLIHKCVDKQTFGSSVYQGANSSSSTVSLAPHPTLAQRKSQFPTLPFDGKYRSNINSLYYLYLRRPFFHFHRNACSVCPWRFDYITENNTSVTNHDEKRSLICPITCIKRDP